MGLPKGKFHLGCKVILYGGPWHLVPLETCTKCWFSLVVCSEATDLKINIGNCDYQAEKAHHSQALINAKMVEMRML